MTDISAPLRLRLDRSALIANWRWLSKLSENASCGAAIKANGYGLGAVEVMQILTSAGCRDFFVSNWTEAKALEHLHADGINLSVLHGVRNEDMAGAMSSWAKPVLISEKQIARWREARGGVCDVMVDTGMNRLGLSWREQLTDIAGDLHVDTLHSHLVSAEENVALNALQLERFHIAKSQIDADRYSLANSAGISLGSEFLFDLTRPGIALYGGVPVASMGSNLNQVVFPEAQILQRRLVRQGESIGYNATHVAASDMEIAILNIGYADGYLRSFSGCGFVFAGDTRLPIVGRVSMDLIAVSVDEMPSLQEGEWLTIDYALPLASKISGLSQYELITGLGQRFDRIWR